MAKQRVRGIRSRERVPSGAPGAPQPPIAPPISRSSARDESDDERTDPSADAALPRLSPNDLGACRTLRELAGAALRVLSEGSLSGDVSEYLGDNLKPLFDEAHWKLRRLIDG